MNSAVEIEAAKKWKQKEIAEGRYRMNAFELSVASQLIFLIGPKEKSTQKDYKKKYISIRPK